jgi:YaiO family outer membrane protein
VDSHSAFGAITWGEDGNQYVTLRHDRGREAYQSIGENVLLVDFPSHVTSLSWRRWLSPRCGFNLRVERYASANYDRTGGEAGVFCGY